MHGRKIKCKILKFTLTVYSGCFDFTELSDCARYSRFTILNNIKHFSCYLTKFVTV